MSRLYVRMHVHLHAAFECWMHVRLNVRLHVSKEVSASRILFRMEKAAPFGKGGFLQASFFPKLNAGEFRDLRIATRGSASGLRELLKKFDQNFNPVRAGCVVCIFVTPLSNYRAAIPPFFTFHSSPFTLHFFLGAVTSKKPPRGVYFDCGDSPRNRLPEGNARGDSPPGGKWQRALPATRR